MPRDHRPRPLAVKPPVRAARPLWPVTLRVLAARFSFMVATSLAQLRFGRGPRRGAQEFSSRSDPAGRVSVVGRARAEMWSRQEDASAVHPSVLEVVEGISEGIGWFVR
jgi:hypothetical protein